MVKEMMLKVLCTTYLGKWHNKNENYWMRINYATEQYKQENCQDSRLISIVIGVQNQYFNDSSLKVNTFNGSITTYLQEEVF